MTALLLLKLKLSREAIALEKLIPGVQDPVTSTRRLKKKAHRPRTAELTGDLQKCGPKQQADWLTSRIWDRK